jgi:hypothetical protein
MQELESLVRLAVFKPANEVVGYLFQHRANRIDLTYQPKPGEQRKGRKTVVVQCIFGSFKLERDYYYHEGKKQGHYPADAALGLEGAYTPALARLICLEGADEASYQKAEQHLAETGGIKISGRQIQRVVQRVGQEAQAWQKREVHPAECSTAEVPKFYVSADGTGAPMRKEELQGRVGRPSDQRAKTRQVYLGCVFTQHTRDEEGRPIRDANSTTYVSSLEPIDDFGPMLRKEALRRGMSSAQEVVLLIDGAEGLENMGVLCFKGALQIVDFYHSLVHASEVLEALLGSKEHPEYAARRRRWAKDLLKNKVQKLIDQTRQEAEAKGKLESVEKELGYFVRNVRRMQYGTYRQKDYFIGSGVIEAGCKTVVGARCKQSGMFWTVKGAEHILAFRCIHSSRRLDAFWKHRLNQHAARNDALSLAA